MPTTPMLRRLLPLLLWAASVAFAQPAGLWLDASGRPNAAARDALALLGAAGDDGLDPADYRAAALAADAARLDAAAGDAPPAQLTAFDAALSANMLRFMRELHAGRVTPRAAGFALPPHHAEHDFDAPLRAALAAHRLPAAVAELRPPLAQYASLRGALARYRALAALGDAPLPRWAQTLRPGDAAPGLDALRRRLVALGDLDATAPADPARYGGALADAVRRFQRRHALRDDGAIGKQTQAALAVPLAQRTRQIEFALERLRWLPRLDRRFVAVNIPMFRLWAVRPGGPALGLNVIVGRAFDTRTPVLAAELTQVVFRPYWNVPRSIVRNELLAPITRDPSYLARHDMEIVRGGGGDDAQAVPPTPQNLALLRDGVLRLRQRPGARNALGLVKFVFPNGADVYMHGTPAQSLFARPRRDFSHGCIRVEDPVALAQWALQDEPAAWPRERIEQAMHDVRTQAVKLAQPLPVLLYYVTALVLPDGEVHFADDLYGHDERLARALAAR